MNQPIPQDPPGEIIDVGHIRPRRGRRWRWFVLAGIVVLLLVASRGLSIYVSALWFDSLGYSSVYWYMFKLKLELFAIFFALTVLILRTGFWLIERTFASVALDRRTILVNQQPVSFSPARVLRPLAWVVSVVAGLVFGLGMRETWRMFALYLHRVPTELTDPIFHKPIAFYLFTLPVYDAVSAWLLYLSIIILLCAIVYAALAVTQQGLTARGDLASARRTSVAAVSFALAAWLLILAWRFLLSRYPYLWDDHQTFAGVTYTEANYLLPGYVWVAGALALAAAIALVNAFVIRRVKILIAGVALPVLVYVIAASLFPGTFRISSSSPTNLAAKPHTLSTISFRPARHSESTALSNETSKPKPQWKLSTCRTIASRSTTYASGTGGLCRTLSNKYRRFALIMTFLTWTWTVMRSAVRAGR